MDHTPSLAQMFWPSTASRQLYRDAAIVITGSLLVAAAAQITVPMWPVPMTLQTMAVLIVGGFAGARLGLAALALYALEGAVGLPFFAGAKSGLFDAKLSYLFPASSMGYVLGFILAALLVGHLISAWGKSGLLQACLVALVATFVVYVPGLIWLAIWAAKTQGLETGAAILAALHWGLYPFMLGDALKALVAGLSLFGAQSYFASGHRNG